MNELPPATIPASALEAIAADATLPICTTCATQYPCARGDCPCCEDPRQWVPEEGTTWTTLADLTVRHTNTVTPDKEDPRVKFIGTTPTFAIGQNPILIETAGGSYIWDCCALLSPPLIGHLLALEKPLKAMAISHPHFFNTSLIWSRALGVPLYINETDKEWYQRAADIKETDKVVWWRDSAQLGPNVRIIQCGGHFPGSSILHWDRAAEPDAALPGLLLTSDTFMVQQDRKGFTFMWSYPNMIPLGPVAIQRIARIVAPLKYDAASSAWPGRFVRHGARERFESSVAGFLERIGWREDETKGNGTHTGELVPV